MFSSKIDTLYFVDTISEKRIVRICQGKKIGEAKFKQARASHSILRGRRTALKYGLYTCMPLNCGHAHTRRSYDRARKYKWEALKVVKTNERTPLVRPATMSNHHTPSVFDGIDLTEPEQKGYLFKQSRTHTGFNRRYGVLYKKLLVYYENEEHFKRDARKGALEVGL